MVSMNLYISENTISKFIKANLKDKSFGDFIESEELTEFVEQVKAGNEIKVAEIYHSVRGGSIEEARLATSLTKKLID